MDGDAQCVLVIVHDAVADCHLLKKNKKNKIRVYLANFQEIILRVN